MDKKVYKVQLKNVAQSPQKLRLVANLVRGNNAKDAVAKLEFLTKKGSVAVLKGVKSAIANAKHQDGVSIEKLVVSSISVDEAQTLRRVRFASRGRVSTLHKRRSHLNIELSVK